uniref:Chemokine interleukin-8-like domain-containing protein n=1 Tax=Pundamilia nyererei TaxID=303518 RepID=A0A3B4GDJ9_9CICH
LSFFKMVKSESLFALVAVVLLAVALASCCTSVANKKITEPILGYLVQKANAPCVNAVIFHTNDGPLCADPKAQWVKDQILCKWLTEEFSAFDTFLL